MAFEIEIEIDRHFTIGSFREVQGRIEESRTETNSDALGSLMRCMVEGAKKFDCDAQDLLKKTESVKLCAPEIVTETLANNTGARIGLMLSKGYEKEGYFEGKGRNPIFDTMLAKELVVGIEEEVDIHGKQVLIPHEEAVKGYLRHLLEFGSGIIVISFRHSSLNPANEQLVKRFIESDYPRHYLGAVPVLISTDYSSERNDYLRTYVSLLNAYSWFKVDRFLRSVEKLLRQHGYNHTLKVAQADGEVAEIPKVNPLKTCTSDPVRFIKSLSDHVSQSPQRNRRL